jgi:hypothetical protein
MHAQSLGSAFCALYHSACLQEHGGDVIPLNFVKRLEGRRSGLDHFRRLSRCVTKKLGG